STRNKQHSRSSTACHCSIHCSSTAMAEGGVGAPPMESPSPATPEEKGGGRAGLLRLVTVKIPSRSQSGMQVECNLCQHSMAGTNERMAAHFAEVKGHSVTLCSNSTPEAIALGMTVLSGLEHKRNSAPKRARKSEAADSRKRWRDGGAGAGKAGAH
ncbi:unnamed protein product, partial [Laminaria digitata]